MARTSHTPDGSIAGTVVFHNDPLNPTGHTLPAEELSYDVEGLPAATRTYLTADRVLAQHDAPAPPAGGTASSFSLLVDAGGSTRALLSPAGGVVASYDYDAFGTLLGGPDAATQPTPLLFGGDAAFDAGTGQYLHGNGVRFRDRFAFTQRDTFAGWDTDPLSLHKQLYAHGDPVSFSDPSGYMIDTLISVGGGLADTAMKVGTLAGALGQALTVVSALTYLNASITLGLIDAGLFSAEARPQAERLQELAFYGIIAGGALSMLGGGIFAAGFAARVALAGHAATRAADGRAVIGKLSDLRTANLGPGERTLLDRLPDQRSAKANWIQNSSVLRDQMNQGRPIRDASVDAAGNLLNNTGFLRAERALLESHGWTYSPHTQLWSPPR